MKKLLLLLTFLLSSYSVYAMDDRKDELCVGINHGVFTDISNTRSAIVTPLDGSPVNLKFDCERGLRSAPINAVTKIMKSDLLSNGQQTVQQWMTGYYTKNQGNNVALNMIGYQQELHGKKIYCQDFKDGTDTFDETYHLIKNSGYGHNANQQKYTNTVLCFPRGDCKLTLSPSSQPVRFPSTNSKELNLLGVLYGQYLNNHQPADAHNSNLGKGKVFQSIELMPYQNGFTFGYIQGGVDFSNGEFDLTLQNMSIKINLEPSSNYFFVQADN